MLTVPEAIVSCDWLHENLNHPDLRLFDATLPKVTANTNDDSLPLGIIPGAQFFDVKGAFSDHEAQFPNTMLPTSSFVHKARSLGISDASCVVIYDRHGVYSSPRAWYMFRAVGFENVAVLNGGLPEWIAKGFALASEYKKNSLDGDLVAKVPQYEFVSTEAVQKAIESPNSLLLDARSMARFEGKAPEPRAGVRSGHIPNSVSLPYSQVIAGTKMKSATALQEIYKVKNPEEKPMVFSCGTGITACVLALAAAVAGFENFVVYDGSWTEWGSDELLPIEV